MKFPFGFPDTIVHAVSRHDQSYSESLSHVQLFVTPWTIEFMEFSRPEYWSGNSFPFPGDLPNLGIEPKSLALRADSLPAEPQGESGNIGMGSLSFLQWIFPTQKSNQGLLHCRQVFTNRAIREAPELIRPH